MVDLQVSVQIENFLVAALDVELPLRVRVTVGQRVVQTWIVLYHDDDDGRRRKTTTTTDDDEDDAALILSLSTSLTCTLLAGLPPQNKVPFTLSFCLRRNNPLAATIRHSAVTKNNTFAPFILSLKWTRLSQIVGKVFQIYFLEIVWIRKRYC